jgi:hypothetical protein
VDVADQCKEVGVFIAEYGLISVLEQMPGALMAAVIVLGVPREELPHDGGDAVRAALKKNVDMVVHEDPGINGTVPLGDVLAEALQEPGFVLIVVEYL